MGASGGTVAEPKLNGAISDELVTAAEQAGLQYVSDERPGYSRRAKGKHFQYVDTEGKPIRDEQRLCRIKRLAVPPAWTNVWICSSPNGHVQAIGRDARGRKQYRYHERWREVRDENKFERLAQFAKTLPDIRRRIFYCQGFPYLGWNGASGNRAEQAGSVSNQKTGEVEHQNRHLRGSRTSWQYACRLPQVLRTSDDR